MTRTWLHQCIAAGLTMSTAPAHAQVVAKLQPILSQTGRAGRIDLNAPGQLRLRLTYQSGSSWSLSITDPVGHQMTVDNQNVERYRVYGSTIEVLVKSSGSLQLVADGSLEAVVWESLIPSTTGEQRFRQGGPLERIDAAFRQNPANGTVVSWSDAVVRVRWSAPSTPTRWCTGVQIAPQRVLTNRHCLPPDFDVSSPSGEIAVQFGPFSTGLDDISDTLPAKALFAEHAAAMSESYSRDVVNIALTKPPSNPQFANAIIPLATSSVTGRSVMLLSVWGYNTPFGKVVSRGPKCRTEIEREAAWNCYKPIGLYHECETEEGSSGSPIVDASTGQLVGLHYAGLAENSGNCALRVEEIRMLIR